MSYYLREDTKNVTFDFKWTDNLDENRSVKISMSSLSIDIDRAKRSGVPGDSVEAGYEYAAREGTLEFSFGAETRSSFRSFFTDLMAFLSNRNGRYYLVDSDLGQRIRVAFKSIGNSQEVDGHVASKVSLPFVCPYPFWESLALVEASYPFANLEIKDISVPDVADRIFPEYDLTFALSNTDVAVVNLTNSTVTRLQMFLAAGEKVLCSSITGTIKTIGPPAVDVADALVDGAGFLILEPGINRLQLVTGGGGGTFDLRYRQVYL